MKIVLAAVPLINTRVPPLSLASIQAYMEKEGHEVKSFDFNIDTYHAVTDDLKQYWTYYKGFQWNDNSHFENYIYPNIIGKNLPYWTERILSEKPDVVGISVTGTPAGRILAQELKRQCPSIKIVIGGPSCSKSFNDPEKQPCDIYDVVVHNEGEVTFAELIREYEKTNVFKAVPGASVLGSNGEVIFGGLREVQMNLDDFPTPNFDHFDFNRYVDAEDPASTKKEIPYFSSRGCPARCNFCMDYKLWDLRYRQKSPERIVDEMETLSKKYGIKDFMLIELIFNGHMTKMREMLKILNARNLGFRFWGHGRIDPRLDFETIKLLKDVGFFWFIFGLESGSDKMLKLMRKGYNVETADRVLSTMKDVGLWCSVNVIVGFPGETWDDYLETILFVYKHRGAIANEPSLASCMAIPGSDIYLYPEKFGIKSSKDTNFDTIRWESVDGENNYTVREFRKEFMNYVFKQIQFCWIKDKQVIKNFDISEMPNPYEVFKMSEDGLFRPEVYQAVAESKRLRVQNYTRPHQGIPNLV